MQFLIALKLVISMLPLIIDTMKKIEDAIPGQGQGEQKLNAVRTILESVYEIAPEGNVKFDTLWPAIAKIISKLVSLYNGNGTFETAKP